MERTIVGGSIGSPGVCALAQETASVRPNPPGVTAFPSTTGSPGAAGLSRARCTRLGES